jgi:hypothetical protein
MDKEFLEDYAQREWDEINRYFQGLSSGKISKSDRFPPNNRFIKINEPVTYLSQINMPLWSVVAFSGSTIIPLYPIEERFFESIYHLKTNQINEIVSFTEETGKIQFILMKDPRDYQGLKFLDPIFQRLRPPKAEGIPPNQFISEKEDKLLFEEYLTLADLGFNDFFEKEFKYNWNRSLVDSNRITFSRNYVMAKAFASATFNQDMEDALVSDFQRFYEIMMALSVFVFDPLFNPLQCTQCLDLEPYREVAEWANREGIQAKNRPFPCELGRLLMEKLMHYPESLEACKQLSAVYKETDVQKLFKAINEGVMLKQPDIIEQRGAELSSVLNNLWKDQSVTKKINGIRFGVPLALGIVGTVSSGLSGSYTGLLSGLGFDALDTLFQLKEESITERIAKAFSSSQQVAIFDFKKRYSIKE